MNGYFRKAEVKFPKAFNDVPLISCHIQYGTHSAKDATSKIGMITNVSASGFTVEVTNQNGDIGNDAYQIAWYAIGA